MKKIGFKWIRVAAIPLQWARKLKWIFDKMLAWIAKGSKNTCPT